MITRQDPEKLIQCHLSIDYFDYDFAVDWAIDLIRQGKETENILMLASFSKPVDSNEIRSYVSAVLDDLKLEEKHGEAAITSKIYFELAEILNGISIRKNLESLYKLCLAYDHNYGLSPFYFLYYAWLELVEIRVNFYYEGANLENIEALLKKEASDWIDKFSNEKQV